MAENDGFAMGYALGQDNNNGNCNNGGMWGDGGWWAIILFAMIFGWGNGGWGVGFAGFSGSPLLHGCNFIFVFLDFCKGAGKFLFDLLVFVIAQIFQLFFQLLDFLPQRLIFFCCFLPEQIHINFPYIDASFTLRFLLFRYLSFYYL